jgi:hypothetical protein
MCFSPHHGRSLADAFGGEWRKVINNEILTKNIITYDDLFSTISHAFKCENCIIGTRRVSTLTFVYFETVFILLLVI